MASHYAVMTEPFLHPAAVDALRFEFDHGTNKFTMAPNRSVSFVLSITSSNVEVAEITDYLQNVADIIPADVPPFTLVFMTKGEMPVIVRMGPTEVNLSTAELPSGD